MADNLATGSTGSVVAFDDISSVFYARMKLVHGADGVNAGDVSTANGLPVQFVAGSSVAVSGTVTVASHAVTNAGTFAVQVNGAALTALELIDNIVLIEDIAHNSGDPGVMALAVRRDANTTLADTTGDYAPLQVDASGSLKVAIISGAGSGGTAMTDDAAFTAATTSFTPMGGIVTSDSVDSGDGGAFAMLANRQQKVTLYDSAGVEIAVGGGTQYVEDAAAAGDPTGNALILVRADSLAAVTTTDGDNIAARGNNKGEQYVKHVDAIPVTDNSSLLTVDYATTGSGTATGALRVELANNGTGLIATVSSVTTCLAVTTLTGSGVAHDGNDSGNPHKIGAKATTSLSAKTMVADNDRSDLFCGTDGVQITRPHCNLEDIVTGNATNTDGTSTQCIAAQAAGIKTYLTLIVLSNSSATAGTVDIKDGSTVKLTIPVPATGGAVVPLPVPLGGTAATAWNFDPSAALTTITCSLVGFKSKV